ncbi:unnamed protein product [Hyaloperonospora brassicae]|uniref:CBF1-interacting co-repressor CIR N-terminal domain-containing protein n=1 Tax=Hyaloperonospora brassicae TaxID=162125 RepID=A0AAV0T7B1_HYABA|nr:unnamed protein product [Hyaloperonospora brassicae]
MGGGGLRILPHKSWHVWRRDNIERVLKDEREHEEKCRERDANERSREQERRAQQLVAKGRDPSSAPNKHVNLFETEESRASGRDVTRYKKTKEKGADETLGKHGQPPWYAQPERAQQELTARQERQNKRNLDLADPLQYMRPQKEPGQRSGSCSVRLEESEGRSWRTYVRTGPAGSDRRKYSGRYDCLSTSRDCKERTRRCRDDFEEKHVEKALKKSSKHRAKKRKHELCNDETLLEELRRERNDREASERRRAEKLMYG